MSDSYKGANMKSFISIILLFPIFYNMFFYFEYMQLKELIELSKNEKVVIIYDDFTSNHGEIVLNTFKSQADGDYKLLNINNQEIKIESVELFVNYLLEQNKQVFLNVSISPTHPTYALIFAKTLQRLSEHENMKITVAAGNQEPTFLLLEEFTREPLDDDIYKALNTKSEDMKEIVKLDRIDYLLSNFGEAFGVLFSNIYTFINGDRDEKIRELVSDVITPILVEHKVKQKEEVVDLYTNNILKFGFSVLLQKKDSHVKLISSSSQLEADGKDEYFLDCRINNMIKNEIREVGVAGTEKNWIIGTSISAPIYLSKIYNSSKKSDL